MGWLVFEFLVATVVLAILSRRTGIAYPIVFVVAGAIMGFIPNLPDVELQPETVFLIVLPILLMSAAWTTDFNEFRKNLRPISLLALGLVVFTTAMVAAIAHAVVDGISWPACFALGAIIAPTDSIAAESIAESVALPRRVMTVLSGESLVNDASALIIYRFALAAALGGAFEAAQIVPQFFLVTIGGVAVGLVTAVVVAFLLKQLIEHDPSDEILPNVVLLISPFASYLVAERLQVSGVLATVACGIWLSRKSSGLLTPDARLLGYGIWEMLTYLLNAFVFLLLGLQLHRIVTTLGYASFNRLLFYGVVISVAVIVLRFVWVFPSTYLPRVFSRRLRERDPSPPWQWIVVIGWSGMRGIVSLAAALALPLYVAARDAVLFITFAVIFATLVVMGSTLPFVIKLLKVQDTSRMDRREVEIRIRALEEGMARLRELEPTFDSEVEWEVQGRIVEEYRHRVEHLGGHLEGSDGDAPMENAVDHRLQGEALTAERRAIQDMRRRGDIPDSIYRNIEYDLDLADARLRAG